MRKDIPEGPLFGDLFENYLGMIGRCFIFEPIRFVNPYIPENNIVNEAEVDMFESMLESIVAGFPGIGEQIEEAALSFNEIYLHNMYLTEVDYISMCEKFKIKQLKSTKIIQFATQDFRCHIIIFNKVTQPKDKHRKKTMFELKMELSEALKKENYEKAAKLQNKINLKKDISDNLK